MTWRMLGVLLGLAVWGTACPADAALVMSGTGTMRFQWIDLRDSAGASLPAVPGGLTAIGDAVAFGSAFGGSYSANYWRNGALSNDVWDKEPIQPGDLYEAELLVSGELMYGPGSVDVDCLTWSTIYFHNETTGSFTAAFSVDYEANLSAADPQKFTDFNMISSELYISNFVDFSSVLEYVDTLSADGVGSYSRSVNGNVLLEPGWTTVDVKRISWIDVASSIPEPSTYALSAVGLALLAVSSGSRRLKRV